MGKQRKKVKKRKKSKYDRICERCGNEVFSFKRIFQCPFCELINRL